MALRDNPYIPLYVQDFLTDEKLSCCSLSTQGAYIRIMCAFHKSETYGGILLKQNVKQTIKQTIKQNSSNVSYFAFILSKQTGISVDEIYNAIEELLVFDVLKIKEVKGEDFLYQKRMVEDNELSEKRSKSGRKGGKNTQKFAKAKCQANTQAKYQANHEANDQAKVKQNPEIENEYILLNNIDNNNSNNIEDYNKINNENLNKNNNNENLNKNNNNEELDKKIIIEETLSKNQEKKEKKEKEKTPKVEILTPEREVLEYLNLTAGKNFRITDVNLKNIRARLKDGYDVEQLKQIIEIKTVEWGGNPEMKQYLRPETLFRPSKIENYWQQVIDARANPEKYRKHYERNNQEAGTNPQTTGTNPFEAARKAYDRMFGTGE